MGFESIPTPKVDDAEKANLQERRANLEMQRGKLLEQMKALPGGEANLGQERNLQNQVNNINQEINSIDLKMRA